MESGGVAEVTWNREALGPKQSVASTPLHSLPDPSLACDMRHATFDTIPLSDVKERQI